MQAAVSEAKQAPYVSQIGTGRVFKAQSSTNPTASYIVVEIPQADGNGMQLICSCPARVPWCRHVKQIREQFPGGDRGSDLATFIGPVEEEI